MTTDERPFKIIESYKQGATLQDIAQELNISRQRVHQLFNKGVFLTIEKLLKNDESVDIDAFIKSIKKEHGRNKLKISFGDFEKKKDELLHKASSYFSLQRFLQEEKISLKTLREHFPEVVDVLRKNAERQRQRWSRFYVRCRNCGTTTIPHQSYGLCRNCYPKSEHFKEIMRASNERNKEKRRKHLREYAKNYSQKPDVVARRQKAWDLKYYGGNREKAIERDNFRCVQCGVGREENKRLSGKDLFVRHIDNNKKNNALGNLKTICYRCFQKEAKG